MCINRCVLIDVYNHIIDREHDNVVCHRLRTVCARIRGVRNGVVMVSKMLLRISVLPELSSDLLSVLSLFPFSVGCVAASALVDAACCSDSLVFRVRISALSSSVSFCNTQAKCIRSRRRFFVDQVRGQLAVTLLLTVYTILRKIYTNYYYYYYYCYYYCYYYYLYCWSTFTNTNR